ACYRGSATGAVPRSMLRKCAARKTGDRQRGEPAIMSCLDATFTLTPLSPTSFSDGSSGMAEDTSGPAYSVALDCYGADFPGWKSNLEWADTNNRFYFDAFVASDPTIDYSHWEKRGRARYVRQV